MYWAISEEELPKEQLHTGATTAGQLVISICVNFGRFRTVHFRKETIKTTATTSADCKHQLRHLASDSFLVSLINSSISNGGPSYITPGRLPVIGTIARALKTASSGSPSCIQGKVR
jgi:hypothetical protein